MKVPIHGSILCGPLLVLKRSERSKGREVLLEASKTFGNIAIDLKGK